MYLLHGAPPRPQLEALSIMSIASVLVAWRTSSSPIGGPNLALGRRSRYSITSLREYTACLALAFRTCEAVMRGSHTRQSYQAVMPSSHAKQSCQAVMPSSHRQVRRSDSCLLCEQLFHSLPHIPHLPYLRCMLTVSSASSFSIVSHTYRTYHTYDACLPSHLRAALP